MGTLEREKVDSQVTHLFIYCRHVDGMSAASSPNTDVTEVSKHFSFIHSWVQIAREGKMVPSTFLMYIFQETMTDGFR